MTHTLWRSDCCECIAIVDVDTPPSIIYVEWIQKCAIHVSFNNQDFIDEMAIQNRLYKIMPNSTPAQRDVNNSDKRNEMARINAIAPPVVNPNA